MSQHTRRRVADQVHLLRDATLLPFRDVLDPRMVADALAGERVTSCGRIYTPLVTLCTFLSQVLSPDHSCREAVARLIAWLVSCGRKPCAAETGSYCEARQRLPLGVITRLVRRTGQELDDRAPVGWRWKGRSVLLVDGTTVSMPDTPENQRAFPQSRSQGIGLGFPLARLVAVISLATGAVRALAIGPYKGKRTGETALFRALWDSLNPGDIALGDRSFASYFGIAALAQRGVDGLFRMHQSRKVDFRRGRRLGALDHVVRWTRPARPDWMDEATYARMPDELCVRELRVKVEQPGFRVDELVLATTMLDPEEYGKDDLADLFLERWNIELDLRSIKDVLRMDVLRCKSPEMVEKEIGVHLLAYNLVRGVMSRAAQAHGEQPRHLGFKGTLQTMTAFQDMLRQAAPARRAHLLEEMLRAIASHRVGDRFGRVEPRANKRRPKPQRYLTEPRDQARKRLLNRA
jgi:Transposase DDE domain